MLNRRVLPGQHRDGGGRMNASSVGSGVVELCRRADSKVVQSRSLALLLCRCFLQVNLLRWYLTDVSLHIRKGVLQLGFAISFQFPCLRSCRYALLAAQGLAVA